MLDLSAPPKLAIPSPAGEAWELVTSDATTLQSLHTLLLEGLDALAAQPHRPFAPPDVYAARTRVRMNAIEVQTRQELLTQVERGEGSPSCSASAWTSPICERLTRTGSNHLYRLHQALAAEVDEDAPE